LRFQRTRAMNRHAQSERRKGNKTNMSTEETNTAATVTERGAHVAPEKTSPRKGATRKKGAPKGRKTARGAKAKAGAPKKAPKAGKKAAKSAAPAKRASAPRRESKGAKILEMIGRAKGATLAEIMKATEWQAHSVRGFISTAGKKQGIKIESAKSETGERTYKTAK
jgi:hypothetical protein